MAASSEPHEAASVPERLSWERVTADSRALAAALAARGGVRGIVAVSRGGLVPAALVAYALGCRLVESVGVLAYENDRRTRPTLLKPPVAAGDGDGFAVVDDMVDHGATLGLVREVLPRAVFACLYAKPAGRHATDLAVADVPQDVWLVFPWEMPD